MSTQAVSPYVLVGTDGSSSALRAVNWAAAEAQRRRVRLVIAHIVDVGVFTYDPLVRAQFTDEIGEAGQDVIAAAEQRVEKHFPDVPCSAVIDAGDPAAELLRLTRHAVLTVVGATGRGRFSSLLMGSVAMALITQGSSPVAVIRSAENEAVPVSGPVIVGIDGTETSVDAVARAFDEASRRRVPLIAVHNWTFYLSSVAPLAAAGDAHRAMAKQEAEERRVLAESLAGWQEKYPDVVVRRVTEAGKPAEELLELARHAQLVVVGSRGHGEFTGSWFDSVTRALIHHASCPVLVARHQR